ncbi:Zinc carboxypeptidase A 1, partial [Gryllus bimaculatus]
MQTVYVRFVGGRTIDAEKMRQLMATPDGMGRAISFTKYNRYDEIQAYLQELASSYPSIVTVGSLGTSSEGRAIPLIKISTGGNGNRPVVFVDAGIHAREWIAPAMALYIIQQLVENPSNADLIANVDWHIVPLLNPDGYEYSQTSYRLWRKTRSVTTRCTGSDTKNGVDANRNFDFHWM